MQIAPNEKYLLNVIQFSDCWLLDFSIWEQLKFHVRFVYEADRFREPTRIDNKIIKYKLKFI